MKVGILGFAHGHVNAYCQQWREHPDLDVQVVAGWDRDAVRAAEAAKNHGVELCGSSQELLARPDLAAVIIAAETAFHADLVEQAATAGKAIIVQKPLALTLEQADRIVTAVERAGVPFTLAWQMRVDPHNLKMKELLQTGRFGRLLILRRRHCLATHLWKDFERSWHVNPELNRDIFADDAAHALDFVYWMLGMPVSVTAELGTLVNPAIPNDNGIVIFRYADGAFAEVVCSFVAPAGENNTEFTCANGIIVQNYGDLVSTNTPWPPGAIQLKWLVHGEKQWTLSDLPEIRNHGQRLSGLAGPLAEFLHGRRSALATAAEGRDVLRLVLACYESAQEGRRVCLLKN